MPGSLSRVTGCRWRHAGCKGGFAASDDAATDGLVSAPLHSAGFAAGRGRSARLGARETNARRRRTCLRESGAEKWTREKSKSCAKRSAARPCWRKTAGRSTSRKAPDARSSIAATAISSSSSTKAAAGSIPCRPRKGTCFRSPNTSVLTVSSKRATALRMWLASFPAHQRGSVRQGQRPPLRPLHSGGGIASSRVPARRPGAI